ncbi:MAG: type II toxin-antitoxin system HicB family antitoxin [Cyanobacteria bacterium MAG CAR3_bin_5]|nr:type II toxin-antitoxin system HicB family antitoxin [Cyanobacteria bacterium MAG CAR3_bin_5]
MAPTTNQRPFSAISSKRIPHESSLSSRIYIATTTKCLDTGFYVGRIEAIPGAFTQGETLEQLNENLKEVISILNNENVFVIIKNNIVDNKTYDTV